MFFFFFVPYPLRRFQVDGSRERIFVKSVNEDFAYRRAIKFNKFARAKSNVLNCLMLSHFTPNSSNNSNIHTDFVAHIHKSKIL